MSIPTMTIHSFNLLFDYAQAEEAKRELDALEFGYYADLDDRERTRLWWEVLDRAFPTIGATCLPVTLEELTAWALKEERIDADPANEQETLARWAELTPAQLRSERWRYYCDDHWDDWNSSDYRSDHVDWKLDRHLRDLRHQALAAAGQPAAELATLATDDLSTARAEVEGWKQHSARLQEQVNDLANVSKHQSARIEELKAERDSAQALYSETLETLKATTNTLQIRTYELSCLEANLERRLPVWAQILGGLVVAFMIAAIAHRAGFEAGQGWSK